MSLFIECMDMPKNRGFSYDCLLTFSDDGSCELLFNRKRYPVVEIPTPHGDLIDRDVLLRTNIDTANYPSNWVKSAAALIKEEDL